MNSEDYVREKRALLEEIDKLRKVNHAFRIRASIIANIFLPGIGFLIFGKGYITGILTLIVFVTYNFFFLLPFNWELFPDNFLVLIPGLLIIFFSSIAVGSLED
ncbi:hypothetical protein [Oceanobacillus kapialis]|uniref:Histidine kinase n=1 Tax=Oceanobacillus kapialis TaxID=481353 RepID=A0ABW5Q172_9BACI